MSDQSKLLRRPAGRIFRRSFLLFSAEEQSRFAAGRDAGELTTNGCAAATAAIEQVAMLAVSCYASGLANMFSLLLKQPCISVFPLLLPLHVFAG